VSVVLRHLGVHSGRQAGGVSNVKINEKGDPKDAYRLQVLRSKGSRDSGARDFRAATYFTTLVLDDVRHPVSAIPGNQEDNSTNRKRSYYQSERKDGTSRTNLERAITEEEKVMERWTMRDTQGGVEL
jgi:hypothetical protein